ncbi:MAG TPA: ABC transporter substrate-binding protein [Firmicutes bacterium]|mgnify:CR=1 FL=1|nr:ABC transporter substrate-binding protein [Bacillota bacterium]
MNSRRQLFILVLLMSILLVTPLVEAFPVTVTDSLGREVTVTKRPQRIISLAPASTENLFRLGLADRIVGVTEFCNYPPEAAAKPKVGDFFTPSLEMVIVQEPDLVVTAGGLHVTLQHIARLEELGVPVYVYEPSSLEEVMSGIMNLGLITDTVAAAEEIVAQMRREIAEVQSLVAAQREKPEVFVLIGIYEGFISSVGPNTFIGDVVEVAGGLNAARESIEEWPRYSFEVLLEKDPDVILSTTEYYPDGATSVYELYGWDALSAVRNKRVHQVSNLDAINRGTYRTTGILLEIAQVFYPGLVD